MKMYLKYIMAKHTKLKKMYTAFIAIEMFDIKKLIWA